MVATATRELILPAIRLDVPDRPTSGPSDQAGADAWTTTPAEWLFGQVVRLAVAQVLESRLQSIDPERLQRASLPADPAELTLAKLAGLFRPHVDLAAQAFSVAVVEHLNAGLPALTEPVREGLRRSGVTGRDRIQAIALGLDKVPGRARGEFWKSLGGSAAVTGLVDALATSTGGQGTHDVTTLDRSHLARADVVLHAGGRTVGLTVGQPPREDAGSWLRTNLAVNRQPSNPLRPGAVEVVVKPTGWTEVHETALVAVSAAMQEIDLGGRPRGRATGVAAALAGRLAAARQRTVADVLASLRDVDASVRDGYGPQITTTAVRVPVPVVEDEQMMELWLPSSALAGPLFTGAADLFVGPDAEVRSFTRGPKERGPQGQGSGSGPRDRGGRPGGGDGRQGPRPGKGRRRKGGGRPEGAPPSAAPSAPPSAPSPEAAAPTQAPPEPQSNP